MGIPSWEVWLALQHMSIPQQAALFGTPSGIVTMDKPTTKEMLAELVKARKAQKEAAARAAGEQK